MHQFGVPPDQIADADRTVRRISDTVLSCATDEAVASAADCELPPALD